ncbi:PREDICTED: homeobox-DDT domain protein RLT3 isoform X2 [Nelumbo nucifera]|uniref:Homeobox-DDT domain protein RLT3 isoform X2 n=2 Tax=Nelumbo nucifera TaxID=4432 RepID=A0A1U8BDZ0_NELNU|nr:PREDICTED: homeobox-DDT domain protein RLT3 isoform X2 [Nelumbo nucifera]DAD32700.1 TPA_asm: hypothetical protein HUJ06_011551 [Nelumbo nucifera]
MGNDDVAKMKQKHGSKRKTQFQLESLENFYSEEQYPTQAVMEDYATALNLTYKQVRGWFVERRRKDKRENEESGEASTVKVRSSMVRRKTNKLKRKLYCLQDIFPSDYILKKVFRKDGPPLGSEFDALPAGAFHHCKDSRNSHPACRDNQRALKKRKISKSSNPDSQICKSAPVKKHGIGKGLMTVWRATNPDAKGLPAGVNFTGIETGNIQPSLASSKSKKQGREKRLQHQRLLERRLDNKLQNKKTSMRKRKTECNKDGHPKRLHNVECKLALEGLRSLEQPNELAVQVDDEELELRELQAGPNPLTCCDHLATNGIHGCSLCKDLLARFPPHSVKMKQAFCMQPWNSSPELVKKLFKVFHFLYTHSVAIELCPFTLDEFAQAFHDKDSLLLGKIHVSLLKLLLSDVAIELSNGYLPRMSKDCRFLWFLHSVENQEFLVKFWNESLNPLTWTEVLRQILVAAGFGLKQSTLRKEALNKEGNGMARYGLRSGTLKGELFSILSEQGASGSKVSELAKALQIVELNLTSTTDELEHLICSTLSSDITLFEKISPFAYRLRINPLVPMAAEDFQSESEDSGSVDYDSDENGSSDSSDDSDLDSATNNLSIIRYKGHRKRMNNMLTLHTEIDESNSGEMWVLGLMEGEYSDLSIEEKLNALVALVDLASAGSSLRMEDHTRVRTATVPDSWCHGSGAKIKRSSAMQKNLAVAIYPQSGFRETHKPLEVLPIDSSTTVLKTCRKEKCSSRTSCSKAKAAEATEMVGSDVHPLQSVYLGSDRRYNRYWLFLGPCNESDPGHRRVYFESSEDGHWEVIDTEEALCALLSVLDRRGAREAHLLASLEKRGTFLCQAMSNKMAVDTEARQSTQSDQSEIDSVGVEGSSPVSDIDNNLCLTETANGSLPSSAAIVLELGKKIEEQRQKWNRLQAFDSWIWNSFYLDLNVVKHGKRSYVDSLARCESCHDLYWRDEKHCKICHTTFELDFELEERYTIHVGTCREKDNGMLPNHKVLSSQLQSLKAAIHAIESVMPEDALLGAWKKSAHKLWVKRLRRTSSLPELLQVLGDFVGAINVEWLSQCSSSLCCNATVDEIIVFFPTMPQTTSAVALWLVKLDTLIAPCLERIHSEKTQERNSRLKGRRVPT